MGTILRDLWNLMRGAWNPERWPQAGQGDLTPAVPLKGGHNDLSRWEGQEGALRRPEAPGRSQRPKFDLYGPIPGCQATLGAVFDAETGAPFKGRVPDRVSPHAIAAAFNAHPLIKAVIDEDQPHFEPCSHARIGGFPHWCFDTCATQRDCLAIGCRMGHGN